MNNPADVESKQQYLHKGADIYRYFNKKSSNSAGMTCFIFGTCVLVICKDIFLIN